MAGINSVRGYTLIDPTFEYGYPYENRYHNVGQLATVYPTKPMGTVGDYGPVQVSTIRYTDYNRTSVYPLDSNGRPNQCLPTESLSGSFPCYESKYPEVFIPTNNYFSGSIPGNTSLNPSSFPQLNPVRSNFEFYSKLPNV